MTDEQFLESMHILPEPIASRSRPQEQAAAALRHVEMHEDPQGYVVSHVAVEIRRSEEPGYVEMTEEHCFALLQANREVAQLATDRLRAITNWVNRAGENSREKDQWRRAFWVLAIGVAAAIVARVIWDWLAS